MCNHKYALFKTKWRKCTNSLGWWHAYVYTLQFKLKSCARKECCKQCRYVKFKGTMTKWPVQKPTHSDTKKRRTPWRNRHLEKTIFVICSPVNQARRHDQPLHSDGQVPHEPERHQAVAHVQARGRAAEVALLYHGLARPGKHALTYGHRAGGRWGVRLRWWVQLAQDWGLCRHVCSHYMYGWCIL